MSVAAAAATTFGFGAKAMAQGRGTGGGAPGADAGGGRGAQQVPVPPVPLDNGEPISWTFQPYPGGTGALLEKTYVEKGPAAFKRQPFAWTPTPGAFRIDPWGAAPFPTNDEDIAFLPAHRLGAAIKSGKLTSTRLTKIYLDRLKKYNDTLMCAVTIMEEQGLADAAKADAEIKAGKYRGPLHGIPWGVKDLFAVKGTPTTWGAADFENRVTDQDAEVFVRLRNAARCSSRNWRRASSRRAAIGFAAAQGIRGISRRVQVDHRRVPDQRRARRVWRSALGRKRRVQL